jgi:hypothetical protein
MCNTSAVLSSLMLPRLPLTKQAGDSTKGSERMGHKKGPCCVPVHVPAIHMPVENTLTCSWEPTGVQWVLSITMQR